MATSSTSKRNWLERHARVGTKKHKGIKAEDRLALLQQLTTLLNAGTPLLDALYMCAEQSLSLRLASVVNQIAAKVVSGTAFHKACEAYPSVFESHWIQIIQVGEMTGQMASVMSQLCEQTHNAQKMKGKLISAMVYPCILTGVAILCIVVMLWKVVPTFAAFFQDFGAKLPAITTAVLRMSKLFRTRGPYALGGIIAGVFAFRWWVRKDSGRRTFNQVTMATPVIGEMVVLVAMEKIAGNLGLLLRSGVPLLQSLDTVRGVTRSNVIYRRSIEQVVRQVSSGGSLAGALEATALYPAMFVGMVKVGENSGKLPAVLEQIAGFYRQKIEIALQRVMSMIEPVIIIVMGVTVGFIMAAIYLPMFQLSSAAK